MATMSVEFGDNSVAPLTTNQRTFPQFTRPFDLWEAIARSGVSTVESGCVTLQSLVLSIRIMCKDLWKLLHDNYHSVLTEWDYESIRYKPYLTRREMPRITQHVSDVSVVTSNGQRSRMHYQSGRRIICVD
jgi:hypothetical protein